MVINNDDESTKNFTYISMIDPKSKVSPNSPPKFALASFLSDCDKKKLPVRLNGSESFDWNRKKRKEKMIIINDINVQCGYVWENAFNSLPLIATRVSSNKKPP